MTDVSVVVRDTDTGSDHLVKSNDAGLYVAPLLQRSQFIGLSHRWDESTRQRW